MMNGYEKHGFDDEPEPGTNFVKAFDAFREFSRSSSPWPSARRPLRHRVLLLRRPAPPR
jgi:hypothetical protein